MRVSANMTGGVKLIELSTFVDERGSLAVTFNIDAAGRLGISDEFVQDVHSVSLHRGTVRGLHFQLPPWEQGKLVRVVRGRVLDVAVDLRPGSSTRGEVVAVELAGHDQHALWIPRGFAHGFCTLEEHTEVAYKVDNAYRPEVERTLSWNDPALPIDWPAPSHGVTVSAKDADGLPLAAVLDEVDSVFKARS